MVLTVKIAGIWNVTLSSLVEITTTLEELGVSISKTE